MNPDERLAEGLSRARKLANERATIDGLRLLDALCLAFPRAVEPNVLTAFLAREAGRYQRALEAARRACFLAPDQPITHYLMGACLSHSRESAQAKLHFQTALALLAQIADLRSPLRFGEGLTGSQLQGMIDGYQAWS